MTASILTDRAISRHVTAEGEEGGDPRLRWRKRTITGGTHVRLSSHRGERPLTVTVWEGGRLTMEGMLGAGRRHHQLEIGKTLKSIFPKHF